MYNYVIIVSEGIFTKPGFKIDRTLEKIFNGIRRNDKIILPGEVYIENNSMKYFARTIEEISGKEIIKLRDKFLRNGAGLTIFKLDRLTEI
jgi:hypothetical protein